MARGKTEPSTDRTCPICGASAVAGFAPFCSGRCADVDLARWLNGAYAIPVNTSDQDGFTEVDDEE